MKKNGFIATSILYSFFLIFLTLFVALIANYINNRMLLNRLDEDARTKLAKINKIQFADIEYGDFVTFKHYEYKKNATEFVFKDPILNENANWVFFYKDTTDATYNKYYFLSSPNANKVLIEIPTQFETTEQEHSMNLDLYKYMQTTVPMNLYNYMLTNHSAKAALYNTSYYNLAIGFDDDFTHTTPYYKTSIRIPTTNDLNIIKNMNYKKAETSENYSDDVKESILNYGGDYIIKDSTVSNADDGYYMLRTYNFTSNLTEHKGSINVPAMLLDYCNVQLSGDKVVYKGGSREVFSFANKVRETTTSDSYINYCYYASRVAYDHTNKEYDKLVLKDNTRSDYKTGATGDKITLLSEQVPFRLLLELQVLKTKDGNTAADSVYIDSGRGLSNDPYRFIKGVRR